MFVDELRSKELPVVVSAAGGGKSLLVLCNQPGEYSIMSSLRFSNLLMW